MSGDEDFKINSDDPRFDKVLGTSASEEVAAAADKCTALREARVVAYTARDPVAVAEITRRLAEAEIAAADAIDEALARATQ